MSKLNKINFQAFNQLVNENLKKEGLKNFDNSSKLLFDFYKDAAKNDGGKDDEMLEANSDGLKDFVQKAINSLKAKGMICIEVQETEPNEEPEETLQLEFNRPSFKSYRNYYDYVKQNYPNEVEKYGEREVVRAYKKAANVDLKTPLRQTFLENPPKLEFDE